MFVTVKPLVLASASPRRKTFLTDLGLCFRVSPADLDESPQPGEHPSEYVVRIAEKKARMIGDEDGSAWTLAADTTVVLDGEMLGKPRHEEEAIAMLRRLAGREHLVLTGYALYCRDEAFCSVDCVATKVRFIPFDEQLARAYVRTGEPLDKAGGYGIQGMGGMLVAAINGSYSNVVGLPLAEIVTALTAQGIIGVRRSGSTDRQTPRA
jgi:septum formation protein